MRRKHILGMWIVALGATAMGLCLIASGCGTRAASEEEQQSHLKPLALLYGRYTGQHRGQSPRDEAAFKEFVKAQGGSFLSEFGISDADSLFISERDGKPYVVIYGKATGPAELAGSPVVAYEQEGLGGMRFVANTLGAVEEVDEARFKHLVPGGP